MNLAIDERRVQRLNQRKDEPGPVIYWMSRDQRVRHNWALLFASLKANQLGQPLEVVFTLAPGFLDAPMRHYDFMFRGLREVERNLRSMGVALTVLYGEPNETLPEYAAKRNAGVIVADFSPLKLVRGWKRAVSPRLSCAFYEVDAHNIVPCWLASPKQEYAARTIRPKLNALRNEFLTDFPEPELWNQPDKLPLPVKWDEIETLLKIDRSIKAVPGLEPGELAAETRLRDFVDGRLSRYADERNDPNSGAVSGLSPYLHFGQLSAQHAALEAARSSTAAEASREAFVEELFIRRELSENYCYYNERYDSYDGIADWAKATLMKHADDRRDAIYTPEQFERAQTHDPLWNAAQAQLLEAGVIHGYMRMYWAKKILEWSATPASAFDIALKLNDRYAIDGRDPNGYVGVAWSIGGLHDRPWTERPVYGTIRYMNSNGCKRKFDVPRYIASMTGKSQPALF